MASIVFGGTGGAGGTEICNATYIPRYVKHESAPIRELTLLELAGEDGAVLVSERYGIKYITVVGKLTAASRSALDTAIDSFKELFSRKEKELDIEWEAGTRRYVATCVSHNFDRDFFHNLFVPWSAEFIVAKGIGEDPSEVTLVNEEVFGSGSWDEVLTFVGSARPKPTIKIDPQSNVSATKGLSIENADKDQRIVVPIPDGIEASKYVEVDCRLKTVKYGGSEVSFFGQFPDFEIGSNNLEVKVGNVIDQKFEGVAPGSRAVYGSIKAAQSFTVSNRSASYFRLALKVMKFGTLDAGSMNVSIQPDVGGVPSGTPVTNAEFTLTAATVSDVDFEWFPMFATDNLQFTLEANTRYWIVLDGNFLGDISNFIGWNVSIGVNATYKRGNVAYYDGSWIQRAEDLLFRLYFMGNQYGANSKGTVKYYKRYL